jgi:hypothetical protein
MIFFDPFFRKMFSLLYKTLLAQSFSTVELYHWLKYLHNFQSHPVLIKSESFC